MKKLSLLLAVVFCFGSMAIVAPAKKASPIASTAVAKVLKVKKGPVVKKMAPVKAPVKKGK